MLGSIQKVGIIILTVSSLGIASNIINPLPSLGQVVTFADGTYCQGSFQPNSLTLNGRGVCVYGGSGNEKATYRGDFRNGVPNGTGVFVFGNGDRYQGQFLNGQPNGRGEFIYDNDNRYQGQFRNGVPNGTGTFIFTDGTRYQGQFRDGQFHARGVLTYTNGDRFQGQFILG